MAHSAHFNYLCMGNFSPDQPTMKQHIRYTPGQRMRELIADNNLLLMAISRFDIAFGFGDSTVEEVCRNNGIDTDTFLSVCNLLSGNDFSASQVSLPTLMAYLRRAHTSFLDFYLPKIRWNLINAINYSVTNDVAFQLIKFYDDYVVEVNRHMNYENEVVFCYVDNLLNGKISEEFSISEFSVNHNHMATKLKELKDIFIYHYKQKDNARLSSALFDIIVCEKDFMSHFDVEARLFVPAVETLENSLRSRLTAGGTTAPATDNDAENDPAVALLSDREKDIIRHIAKGYANKAIADTLCLSVHTVNTHRRNICAKLNIHSSAGLTIFALLHHLVNLDDVAPDQ